MCCNDCQRVKTTIIMYVFDLSVKSTYMYMRVSTGACRMQQCFFVRSFTHILSIDFEIVCINNLISLQIDGVRFICVTIWQNTMCDDSESEGMMLPNCWCWCQNRQHGAANRTTYSINDMSHVKVKLSQLHMEHIRVRISRVHLRSHITNVLWTHV